MGPCVFLIVILSSFLLNSSQIRMSVTTEDHFRSKRWSLTEIQRCGPVKGYSCRTHQDCRERYKSNRVVCFEVYPCLSSCIRVGQLLDMPKLLKQVMALLVNGTVVNPMQTPEEVLRFQAEFLANKTRRGG
ncbi:hypothetical protein D915_003063 [Fasciola hepatica]|uniref:Uncharacterized protein n=1 Tax=Fasciola hepatica TaxID=6192 RepID=A0A4E0RF81_FASHE|nr:hypothetical protein D915_003063 [Fasciola hepatica]